LQTPPGYTPTNPTDRQNLILVEPCLLTIRPVEQITKPLPVGPDKAAEALLHPLRQLCLISRLLAKPATEKAHGAQGVVPEGIGLHRFPICGLTTHSRRPWHPSRSAAVTAQLPQAASHRAEHLCRQDKGFASGSS